MQPRFYNAMNALGNTRAEIATSREANLRQMLDQPDIDDKSPSAQALYVKHEDAQIREIDDALRVLANNEAETYTVVVGSAYRDGGESYYIVKAPCPEKACEFAVMVAKAHDSSRSTALYCMSGVVQFQPTVFVGPDAGDPYVPEVIDLRGF